MLINLRAMMRRDEKGFTLVELIVVMAILAVLAGLAVPKFSQILERSKVKADVANRDMIQNALDIYQSDKGSYPSDASFTALMANTDFVGANAYLKAEVTASHPDGSFSYTSGTGKVAYSNSDTDWDTAAEIAAIVPGYKE